MINFYLRFVNKVNMIFLMNYDLIKFKRILWLSVYENYNYDKFFKVFLNLDGYIK